MSGEQARELVTVPVAEVVDIDGLAEQLVRDDGNARSGSSAKTVRTEIGQWVQRTRRTRRPFGVTRSPSRADRVRDWSGIRCGTAGTPRLVPTGPPA